MARFNEILTGRFNRAAQKIFSMKGTASLVSLSDELFAVIPFFWGAENRYLESWEIFASAFSVAAGGAGFNSVIRFRNPVGSNTIAVIEKITFGGTVVGNPNVQNDPGQTADFATLNVLTNTRLDARTRPTPSIVISNQNNAAFTTGNTIWSGFFAANGMVDYILTDDQEHPVLPGNAIDVRESQANVALGVSIRWRERALEESERT